MWFDGWMSKNWEILTEYLNFIFFNALTLALNRRKPLAPRAPCCARSKREKWTVMLSSALPILLCQIVFGKKYRLQLDCKCQEITWKLLPCLAEGKKGRDWMDSISKFYIQGNIKTLMNLVILLMSCWADWAESAILVKYSTFEGVFCMGKKYT